MSTTTVRSVVLTFAAALFCWACMVSAEEGRTPRSTLVVGIDVSGSFRQHYDDAIDFAAHYLYGHINGLGELRTPSAVFVGSVGGEHPGEAKSFQPVHTFRDKTVDEIADLLRELYPPEDSYTDFNVFFDRVATLVKRQGLILAPLEVVLLTDGVNDVRATGKPSRDPYRQIDVGPLEYLSRNVTVRLLYASPTVAVNWERTVPRKRVRMWTVDAPVMSGWQEQVGSDRSIDGGQDLWKWIKDNVDFRVRSRRL
jgi:hypothetical protein